jgi:hypothetical protein
VAKNAFFIGFGGSNGQNETVLVRDGRAVEGHRTPRRWRVDRYPPNARSVLECASPLALWAGATAKTATGTGALPGKVPIGGRAQAPANGSLGWTNGLFSVGLN